MNRPILITTGILGGLLLAGILIFTATPQNRLEINKVTPAKSAKTTPAPPRSALKKNNKEAVKPQPAIQHSSADTESQCQITEEAWRKSH